MAGYSEVAPRSPFFCIRRADEYEKRDLHHVLKVTLIQPPSTTLDCTQTACPMTHDVYFADCDFSPLCPAEMHPECVIASWDALVLLLDAYNNYRTKGRIGCRKTIECLCKFVGKIEIQFFFFFFFLLWRSRPFIIYQLEPTVPTVYGFLEVFSDVINGTLTADTF